MNQRLAQFIDQVLAGMKEPPSISNLNEAVRDAGWPVTTSTGEFEYLLEELGFKFDRRYGRGGRYVTRTYILPRQS